MGADPDKPRCKKKKELKKEKKMAKLAAKGGDASQEQVSRVMRNPDICLCKNKGADQLRSNCKADQRLCFCY